MTCTCILNMCQTQQTPHSLLVLVGKEYLHQVYVYYIAEYLYIISVNGNLILLPLKSMALCPSTSLERGSMPVKCCVHAKLSLSIVEKDIIELRCSQTSCIGDYFKN